MKIRVCEDHEDEREDDEDDEDEYPSDVGIMRINIKVL